MGKVYCEKRGNSYRFKKIYTHPIKDINLSKSVTYADNSPKTFKLAEEELDDLIAKEINEINDSINIVSDNMLIKELYSKFKKEHVNAKSHATKLAYSRLEKQLSKTHVWNKKVKDLNKMDVLSLNNSISKTYLYNVKVFLKFAYKNSYVNIRFFDFLENYKPESKYRDENKMYFEKDELLKILDFFSDKNSYADLRIGYFLELLILTGARKSELFCIEEDDIVNNEVHITKSCHGKIVGKPKNKSSNRIIYVPDRVMEIKQEMINLKRKANIVSKLLFPTYDGEIIYTSYVWAYLNRRGLPTQLHLYRHTYISLMIDNGVPKDLIKDMVGHTDTKMIDKIYYHKTKGKREKDKLLMIQNGVI